MAKQIDHMSEAGTITVLRVIAWLCAIAGGFGAAGVLVYGSELESPPLLEAAAVAFSGLVGWALLSVFAYVAQCVGRVAMYADREMRAQGAPDED